MRLRAFSTCDFDAVLAELVDAGFLIRYQSEDGARLLQVRTFGKHQHCHRDEKASIYPAPNETRKSTGLPGNRAGSTPVSCLLSLGSDRLSPEDCGEPAAPPSPPPTAVLLFPTTGAEKSWQFVASYLNELQATYEAVDVAAEARKALTWVNANPTRKKTAKGMAAFLVNWLNNGVRRGDFVRRSATTMTALPEADWYDECQRLHQGACQGRYKHGLRMTRDASANEVRA